MKTHFLEKTNGYQFLTSTAYNEQEFKEGEIIQEVTEEIEEKELQQLLKKPWQEVREYIKNKINGLI